MTEQEKQDLDTRLKEEAAKWDGIEKELKEERMTKGEILDRYEQVLLDLAANNAERIRLMDLVTRERAKLTTERNELAKELKALGVVVKGAPRGPRKAKPEQPERKRKS